MPAVLPDLRVVRTSFLDKQLAYAFSYEYTLDCYGVYASSPSTTRLSLRPGREGSAKVFHVLRDDRVPGIDGLGHDIPAQFHVTGLDESAFGWVHATSGTLEGRMVLESPTEKTDNDFIRISVTYGGALQLPDSLKMIDIDPDATKAICASAFVIPFFETTHPKYHWLTEQACLAFGTWQLRKRTVTASFDVYCAE